MAPSGVDAYLIQTDFSDPPPPAPQRPDAKPAPAPSYEQFREGARAVLGPQLFP